MKPHRLSELLGKLVAVANQYHHFESLREYLVRVLYEYIPIEHGSKGAPEQELRIVSGDRMLELAVAEASLARAEEILSLLRCAAKDWDYTGDHRIDAKAIFDALAKYDSARSKAAPSFDLVSHLDRQRAWSGKTFGPGPRTAGLLKHLGDELLEAAEHPGDIDEWIDIVILGFDGAMRNTASSSVEVAVALDAKQTKNEKRAWPDWRTQSPDNAIHHIESHPDQSREAP